MLHSSETLPRPLFGSNLAPPYLRPLRVCQEVSGGRPTVLVCPGEGVSREAVFSVRKPGKSWANWDAMISLLKSVCGNVPPHPRLPWL